MKIDGVRLNELRERRLLTLRDLAEMSGVDYTAISLMERGKRNPHPSTVRKLAEALGVDPADLLNQEHGDDN